MAGRALTIEERHEILVGTVANALALIEEGHETRAYWALDLIPRLIRAWANTQEGNT